MYINYKTIAISATPGIWAPSERDRQKLAEFKSWPMQWATSALETQSFKNINFPWNVYTIGTPIIPVVNSFLLQDPVSNNIIMFDTGACSDSKAFKANWLLLDLDPINVSAIFFTHGDIDHVANAFNTSELINKPKFMSSKDETLINGGDRFCACCGAIKAYGPTLPDDPNLSLFEMEAGFSKDYRFGGLTIKAILTPGHTPGSVVYRVEEDNSSTALYFTGDTIRITPHRLVGMSDMNQKGNFASLRNYILPSILADKNKGKEIWFFSGHTGLTNDADQIINVIQES